MSGSSVPYQLRPNKFVERQAFLDIIDFVRIWNGSGRYLYASMGGRFLEDLRVVEERFGIERLISFETDEQTHRRQQFNRPNRLIECRHQSSGDFIDGFDNLQAGAQSTKCIVWLDYAEANARQVQLQEFERLAALMNPGDLLKVTLNANHQSKVERGRFGSDQAGFFQAAVVEFEKQLNGYIPAGGIDEAHVSKSGFASLLAGCIETATLRALQHSDLHAELLGLTRYQDGQHQMVTATVLIANDKLTAATKGDSRFQEWALKPSSWSDVTQIDVPDLSLREQQVVNATLPRVDDAGAVQTLDGAVVGEPEAVLPFQLDRRAVRSKELMRNYVAHHRYYPTFGQVRP